MSVRDNGCGFVPEKRAGGPRRALGPGEHARVITRVGGELEVTRPSARERPSPPSHRSDHSGYSFHG
jgi:hypothetical protein